MPMTPLRATAAMSVTDFNSVTVMLSVTGVAVPITPQHHVLTDLVSTEQLLLPEVGLEVDIPDLSLEHRNFFDHCFEMAPGDGLVCKRLVQRFFFTDQHLAKFYRCLVH